jgi:hypothetical protein
LDQFHIRCARSRAWMFCSVMGVTVWPSSSILVTASRSRSNASSIETISRGTPSSVQIVSAPLRVSAEE